MCMLLSFQRPPRLVGGDSSASCALRSRAPKRAYESSAPAARGNPSRGQGLISLPRRGRVAGVSGFEGPRWERARVSPRQGARRGLGSLLRGALPRGFRAGVTRHGAGLAGGGRVGGARMSLGEARAHRAVSPSRRGVPARRRRGAFAPGRRPLRRHGGRWCTSGRRAWHRMTVDWCRRARDPRIIGDWSNDAPHACLIRPGVPGAAETHAAPRRDARPDGHDRTKGVRRPAGAGTAACPAGSRARRAARAGRRAAPPATPRRRASRRPAGACGAPRSGRSRRRTRSPRADA